MLTHMRTGNGCDRGRTGNSRCASPESSYTASSYSRLRLSQASDCCSSVRTISSTRLLFPLARAQVCFTAAFSQTSPEPSVRAIEVPVPTDFDLPYQDLTLNTPDGVKLRCYLLTQRKELSNHGAKHIPSSEEETDEQVRTYEWTRILVRSSCE